MILKNLDVKIVDTNGQPIIIQRVRRTNIEGEDGKIKQVDKLEEVEGTLGLCIKEALLRPFAVTERYTEQQIIQRYELYLKLKNGENNVEIPDDLVEEMKVACMQEWHLFAVAQMLILINNNK